MHRYCGQQREKGNEEDFPASIMDWIWSLRRKWYLQTCSDAGILGNTAQFLHLKGLQLGSSRRHSVTRVTTGQQPQQSSGGCGEAVCPGERHSEELWLLGRPKNFQKCTSEIFKEPRSVVEKKEKYVQWYLDRNAKSLFDEAGEGVKPKEYYKIQVFDHRLLKLKWSLHVT